MLRTLTGYWKSLLVLLAGGAVTGAVLQGWFSGLSESQAAGLATIIATAAVLIGPRNKTTVERSAEYRADVEEAGEADRLADDEAI